MLQKIINHKYFYHTLMVIAIVIAIYLFINKKKKEEQFDLLMKSVGDATNTGNASVDNKTAEDASKNLSALDPNYTRYQQKQGTTIKLLTQKSVEDYAKRLYDAKQLYGDNESDVIAVLRAIRYKTQLSQVSEYFARKYKKDLRVYLESFMDGKSTSMKDVVDIINKMV